MATTGAAILGWSSDLTLQTEYGNSYGCGNDPNITVDYTVNTVETYSIMDIS